MAIKITDDCINCEHSRPECPNNAFMHQKKTGSFLMVQLCKMMMNMKLFQMSSSI